MLRILAAITLVIGCVWASPAANYYVDTVLGAPLQNQLAYNRLLPAQLPDFKTEIFNKTFFIKKGKRAEANYVNGQLFGLGNVVRTSECSGPSYSYGAKYINCTLALKSLSTTHRATMRFGNNPSLYADASGNITKTVLFVDFVQRPSQYPQVQKVQIRQKGQVSSKIILHGSGPKKDLETFHKEYKSQISKDYTNILQQRFPVALSQAAAQVQMPQ